MEHEAETIQIHAFSEREAFLHCAGERTFDVILLGTGFYDMEEEAAKYERELNAAEKERFDEEEREKNRLFSEREHAEDEKSADACERLKRAYEKHGDEWAHALYEGGVKNG